MDDQVDAPAPEVACPVAVGDEGDGRLDHTKHLDPITAAAPGAEWRRLGIIDPALAAFALLLYRRRVHAGVRHRLATNQRRRP
jgi:hypothetical protein